MYIFSNTPHRWTDTQGCGVGLADTKLSPLTSHSLIQKPKKLKCPPKTTMTLLVSLASYMLASLHLHIYNNNTSTLYHLTWEFEKPFLISFITLCFIQPKIKEPFTAKNKSNWTAKTSKSSVQLKSKDHSNESSHWILSSGGVDTELIYV